MEKNQRAAVIRVAAFGGHHPIKVTASSRRKVFAACTASPRFKRQAGFGKEGQDLVPASAAAKHASCCQCARRRGGIPDRDRPLPGSRPLVHSLCDRITRSCLADGEAGKIPCSVFYGDRTCGTSRSDGSSPKSEGRGQECPRHTGTRPTRAVSHLLFDSLQAE